MANNKTPEHSHQVSSESINIGETTDIGEGDADKAGLASLGANAANQDDELVQQTQRLTLTRGAQPKEKRRDDSHQAWDQTDATAMQPWERRQPETGIMEVTREKFIAEKTRTRAMVPGTVQKDYAQQLDHGTVHNHMYYGKVGTVMAGPVTYNAPVNYNQPLSNSRAFQRGLSEWDNRVVTDHVQNVETEYANLLQCCSAVTSDDMDDIALKMGRHWMAFGRKLDFGQGVIDGIEYRNPRNQREMCYQLLLEWKERESGAATISAVSKALKDTLIGADEEVLREIFDMLTESHLHETSQPF